MKKAFLVVALFAASISFSNAQSRQGMQGTPEERAKRQTERLSERLTLTADQKSKIEAIYLAQGKSFDSLRTAGGQDADRQAMFQKFQPLREQTNKQIAAVLTEEQKKAYEKIQEEMRSQMGQGRRNGQGGGN